MSDQVSQSHSVKSWDLLENRDSQSLLPLSIALVSHELFQSWMLGKKRKKIRTHHWWELWQLLLICLQHSCLSAMVVSSQVSLQMPAAEDCYEAVGRLNPSLAYRASCCSVTWENLPHFFLKCISLVWAVVRFPKRKMSPVASHAVRSGMLISFCSRCLHKLDARWSLWKRLRVATPLAWRKSNSWMKRKWKKVELNATIASALSDYIFSPSSWLSFYVAEWSTLCCCWTAPHIWSPPSLLTTGWTYRVVLFLCPHCCWLCPAVCLEGSLFFPLCLFLFNMLCDQQECLLNLSTGESRILWQMSQKEAFTLRL